MTYRVVWRKRLIHRIQQATFLALERGADPAVISHAVLEIDHRLSTDPLDEGESRDGNERVLVVHPATVTFEAFPDHGVVLVYRAVFYPGQRA